METKWGRWHALENCPCLSDLLWYPIAVCIIFIHLHNTIQQVETQCFIQQSHISQNVTRRKSLKSTWVSLFADVVVTNCSIHSWQRPHTHAHKLCFYRQKKCRLSCFYVVSQNPVMQPEERSNSVYRQHASTTANQSAFSNSIDYQQQNRAVFLALHVYSHINIICLTIKRVVFNG